MAYDAFMSYSHTADSALAPTLQSALHRFAKPWYKRRALHIFRDQTNLAVNPALWSSIRGALDQSLYFILLASPEAAASPWVAEEAEYWIGKNGLSHFLIVVTGGTLEWDDSAGAFTPERANALPPSILRSFPEEPLYLDLRWTREPGVKLRLSEPRFHEAVLQLASTLDNLPKDDLDGADIRYQRHARWLAASGLIAVLLAGGIALSQTRKSRVISVRNVSLNLAATSAKVLADSPDRAREAALIAIESDRLYPTFESNQALRAAVSVLPAGAKFYPPEEVSPEERVRDMAFSPDGATLAVVRDNGSTQLIDVVNQKAIGYIGPDDQPAAQITLPGAKQGDSGGEPAVSVAFNRTGKLIASGSRDGVVHVWTVPEGREILRVVHGAAVRQVAFSPTANQLVTGAEDGHLRMIDLDHATVLADFTCGEKVVAASFTPSGDQLAAVSSEGVVTVIDAARRTKLRTMGLSEAAFNLEFSHDGKRLATSGGDYAFVWDVATGHQLLKATHSPSAETLTPQQWVVDAALSPDGKFLAYAARGHGLAYVWNVDTGRQILELKHDSAVAAIAFNTDGTKLGTGSYDGTARVWELPSGREIERLPHTQGAEVVRFSPDGNRFAAGGMVGTISVSEARRADRAALISAPDQVRSVAFSPDGKLYAIGTRAHASPFVRIGQTSGKVIGEVAFHGGTAVDKLFFLDSNNIIAQWSDRLFLIAIDRSTATLLPEIRGEKRIDTASKLVGIQTRGVTHLYSLPEMKETATIPDPARSTLLRVAGNGKLLIYEVDQPPNSTFIDFFNVDGKTRLHRISISGELNRATITEAGTTLFTAESEKLQVWDVATAKQRSSVTGSGDIELIAPDPSSTAFATLTHGRISIWDSANGNRISQLPETGYIRAAAFGPDGRYLLAGYDEQSAALWLWRSSDLRDEACARVGSNLSRDEWARWFPAQPYRQICPNLPAGK